MTPKEKAEELVNKFQQDVQIIEEDNDSERFYAKQCALIAVDEIMYLFRFNLFYGYEKHLTYWQQVRKEIEAL
jgi:hypothetical protein